MQQPCHYQNRLKVRAGRSGVLRVLLDRTDGSIACVGVVESDFLISYATTLGEQRYLILECKVWIFKDVVHKDNEFAHDGGEGNLGGFASSA